ncbi:MAG: hypothetical protein D6776_01280 [Planctomycetota bacterium]|nr:MAG: hypothetical protein D6776_01280 [Planctomycetota bacterium]
MAGPQRHKAYLLVEGHGEVEAAGNLIARLSRDVGFLVPWRHPLRWKNLDRWEGGRRGRGGVRQAAEWVRTRTDAAALLILRDEDDGCPREIAPAFAGRLRTLSLPFPTAYVLLHPEYEVLFLPCLDRLGLPPWNAGWEARRGVKEWLSRQLPAGKSYKPTIQQLEWTRKLDLETVRTAGVPCFGTLERALRFLGRAGAGEVYPE